MTGRLEGRTALVTGASRGIGTAIALRLAVEGATAKRRQLMFEVQVNAPMDLAQQVLPAMKAAGQGWILNISSGAARPPAVPPDPLRPVGGTVYGMCKAALERFTTGLASELWAAHIAVNALSPNRVVPTPGSIFHHLIHPDDPTKDEPPEVMAEAALALCSRRPRTLTGRIAYSQDLLDELGLAAPAVGI
jgi:citronellol/citronellal dehydrogenase